MKTRGLAVVASVLVLCATSVASSQRAVQMQTQVSARRVEVGERFQLQLTALSEAGEPVPAQPRLRVPPGFSVQGPSVSSQQQVSISGGSIQQRQGMTASWLLSASRPGTFRVGPPSVSLGGAQIDGQAVQIEVVPATPGGGPRQPRRATDPFDPFDFFKSPGFPALPGFKFDEPDDALSELDSLPPVSEEFRVEHAADKLAFLRATVTPAQVMLGQQVTLRIFAYGGRGPFRETNTSEPSRTDFLSYALVENAQSERMHRIAIDDAVWFVVKLRELALFPIRSGKLTIGAMRMGFEGRGYPASAVHQGLVRESPVVQVAVTEPPLDKRPPGYELGDVGRFSLSAKVEPRELTEGDAVSVIAKLEGVGNLPHKLRTPENKGIEWLEPTAVEQIEPNAGIVQGYRKFTYVVRVQRQGRIDLGEIRLPYWNPERNAYEVARAELGVVDVKPGRAALSKPEPSAPDRLDAFTKPRRALGPVPERPKYFADRPWFWLLLASGPLAVLLVSGGVSAGRRMQRTLDARNKASDTQAAQSLKDARAAALAKDDARVTSAVERALFAAIEGATGLRARAVLKSELAQALSSSGIDSHLASEIGDVLNACDELRFTAQGNVRSEQLVERAATIVARLNKRAGVRQSRRNGG